LQLKKSRRAVRSQSYTLWDMSVRSHHRPRMRWCPSITGPLSLRVMQKLARVKLGLYGQCGCTAIGLATEMALCSSEAEQQRGLVVLSVLGDICACVSGALLLRELGALSIDCLGRRGARSAVFSRVAIPAEEMRLLWLPPFLLFSGVGSLTKSIFVLLSWAEVSGNMVTLCTADSDCRCSLLDNIWFEGFTAMLQLGTLMLCCKALALINEEPVVHGDEAALLAVLRGAIVPESPRCADGDVAAGTAASISRSPSTPADAAEETISICTPQHSDNEGSGGEGAGEDARCGNRSTEDTEEFHAHVPGNLMASCPSTPLRQPIVPKRRAGRTVFRVNVPGGWPGVQYRRTRHMDDRYLRYAVNGTMICGRLEEDGEWLSIGSNVFLPVRVGSVGLVDPIHDEQ